jgi:hypothetical protein
MSIYHSLSALGVTQYASECTGGSYLKFQKKFDGLPCDKIRMEIQTENFFRSLISMRFIWISRKTKSKKIEYNYQWVFF